MNSKKIQRLWEIDFLRGIAIILMVIYHLGFDLHYFVGINLSFESLPWRVLQVVTASLFLLLVGISMSLKFSKHKKVKFSSFLKRGAQVFSLGLIVTLATYIFTEGPVWFGILHLIGASIILGYFFLNNKYLNSLIGLTLIVVGIWLQQTVVIESPYLLWLGFIPQNFFTLDYYPLLPWFGVVLVGIWLGQILYPNHQRIVPLPNYSQLQLIKVTNFLGKNSLTIYLIHQPIILSVLALL